jgi:hypothetical protein
MSTRVLHTDNRGGLTGRLAGAILMLGLALVCLLPASAASAAVQRRALPAGEGEAAPARHGACSITIAGSSTPITAGEGASVSGVLSCANAEESAEQTVSVHCHSAGTAGSSICATATTASDGSFGVRTEALQTNTLIFASAQGARSPRIEVKLGSHVSITNAPADGAQLLLPGQGASASALATNTVTFAGTVSPATAGMRVVLQRERPDGHWQRIALAEANAEGAYSITHTFLLPGEASVRVVARGHGNLDTASETRTYLVSRHQRAGVSIEAPASAVAPGETLTITGVAAGPSGQTVTLLARTRESRFAPVSTSTTGTGGLYSFPPQTPQQSTTYRVKAGHASSISLPVDVEAAPAP